MCIRIAPFPSTMKLLMLVDAKDIKCFNVVLESMFLVNSEIQC